MERNNQEIPKQIVDMICSYAGNLVNLIPEGCTVKVNVNAIQKIVVPGKPPAKSGVIIIAHAAEHVDMTANVSPAIMDPDNGLPPQKN